MSVSAHSAIVADGSSADLEIGKPGWTLIFRTNATEVQLPSERERMIVLPRRSDLIFSMLAETVTDELELSFSIRGLDVHPTAVARAIECFDLSDLLERDPNCLSGGQKARLALALAVLANPAVLVLDNALDAIDVESRGTLRRYLLTYVRSDGLRVIELTSDPSTCTEHADIVIRESAFDSIADRAMPVPTTNAPRRDQQPVLEVKQLEFGYDSGFRLTASKVELFRREIVWLTGRNGSGKTTFMKCLALLLNPGRGSLQVSSLDRGSAQVNFATPARYAIHPWVLYQFQEPDDQIFCATVQEELMISARFGGRKPFAVPEMARILGLSRDMQSSPWALSRSRRRLLSLGSVLCGGAPVALLDEPSAELDPDERERVREALALFVRNGGACIVVSHDQIFMHSVASRRISVDEGQVAEESE